MLPSSQAQAFRQQREEIKQRHSQLKLGPRQHSTPARSHPQWASLGLDQRAPSDAAAQDPGTQAFGPNYVPQEQTFRNDYSQHFVDTGAGRLPGNAVRNPEQETRFVEYPKLERLVQVKDALVTSMAHPPTYLRADLRASVLPYQASRRRQQAFDSHTGSPYSSSTASSSQTPQTPQAPLHDQMQHDAQGVPVRSDFHLGSLMPVKYDVMLIDPPLQSYEWEGASSGLPSSGGTWTWDEIAALPVPLVAAKESFVFLWVGSGAGDGLERGREVLSRWGYRRCEDIVWVRTNPPTEPGEKDDDPRAQQPSTSSALSRSVQHCLMGIRGTVRRSNDTRFVHCNVDTDVILWPGEKEDSPTGLGKSEDRPIDLRSKPPEMYQLIENFCLGTRRLELFGRNRNLRRGWLTIGLEIGPSFPGWPRDGLVDLPRPGLGVLEEDAVCNQDIRNNLQLLCKPQEYIKLSYDSNFGVDKPGCELRDRINLIPFNEESDALRPKSPPPRGGARAREAQATGSTGMPLGLSRNTGMRAADVVYQDMGIGQAVGMMPTVATVAGGGAGLSGLGAGGPRTVSVPSGSDTLSGPQASVLKAKAAAAAAAPPRRAPIPPKPQV